MDSSFNVDKIARVDPGGDRGGDTEFLLGLARAFDGAVLLALPMFMTMEMWTIGASIEAVCFLAFLAVGLLVVILLAYCSGSMPKGRLFLAKPYSPQRIVRLFRESTRKTTTGA